MRKGILFVLHVCISFLAVVTGYSQPMQRLSNSSPVLSSNGKVAAKSPQDSASPMSGFDTSPNTFVANKGQILLPNGEVARDVKYMLNAPGMKVQLRPDGFSYDTYVTQSVKADDSRPKALKSKVAAPVTENYHRVDVRFSGANPSPVIEALGRRNDPITIYNEVFTDGLTLEHYEKVIYKNVYPGIDVEFVANPGSGLPVEYNFIVHPGADPSRIALKYDGYDGIALADGKIKLTLAHATLEENIPASWTGNNQAPVQVAYTLTDNGTVGFDVEAYDRSQDLVIDPTPKLVWGTFFQAATADIDYRSHSVSDVDEDGNVYVIASTTTGTWVTTSGAFQTSKSGESDLIIAKFSNTGQRLAVTYYGGTQPEQYPNIVVRNGFVYFSCTTPSVGLGTLNSPNHTPYGAYDYLVVKMNLNLARVWSRYLGGDYEDQASQGLAVDKDGNIFISAPASAGYPITTGPSPSTRTNTDGDPEYDFDLVATKLSSSGTVAWSKVIANTTYFNKNEIEVFKAGPIKTDTDGNIYFAAGLNGQFDYSSNLDYSTAGSIGTSGSYKPANTASINTSNPNKDEYFLLKYSPAGTKLWGTWLGAVQTDNSVDVNLIDLEIDKEGFPWVAVNSVSLLPVTNDAYQKELPQGYYNINSKENSNKLFIQKYAKDGDSLLYSTLYTGAKAADNWQIDIQFDTLTGNLYLLSHLQYAAPGYSFQDLVTDCAYQSWKGGCPGNNCNNVWHIAKLTQNATQREWGTIFGNLEANSVDGDIHFENNLLYMIAGVREGQAPDTWQDATTQGTYQPDGIPAGGFIIAAFDEGAIPEGVTVSQATLSPLTQVACIGGLVETIKGNKVEVTGPDNYTNAVLYQWQESTSASGPWTDMPGETAKDLTPEPRDSGPVYFRRLSLIPGPACQKVLKGISNVAELTLGTNNAPRANAGGSKFYTCLGNSISFSGSASGGTPPYTYEWYVGSDLEPSSTTTDFTHTPTETTLYSFKITDAVGCFAIDQVAVEPVIADAGGDQPYCGGTAGTVMGIPGVQGTPKVVYSWTPATGLSCTNCSQPVASPTTATTYTLTVSVTEKAGTVCTMEDSAEITPVAPPNNNIYFGGPDRTVCQGDTAQIGLPAASGFTYTWAPGTYLENNKVAKTVYDAGTNVIPNAVKKYSVTALKDGCTFVDFVDVYTIYYQITPRNLTLPCTPRWFKQEAEAGEKNYSATTFEWEKTSGDADIEILALANNGADAYIRLKPGSGNSVTFRRKSTLNGKVCYSFFNTLVTCGGGEEGNNCYTEVRVLGASECPLPGGGYKLYAKYINADEYNFKWSPSWALDNDTLPVPTLLTANSGVQVSLIATNKYANTLQCKDTLLVNDPALDIPVFAISDKVTCPNVPIAIGGSFVEGYEFEWNNTAGMAMPDIDSRVANPNVTLESSETYVVKVTDTETKCVVFDTMTVNVTPVTVDAGGDIQACAGSVVTIGAPAPEGTNFTYLWNPSNVPWKPDGTQGQFLPNPSLLFAGADLTMVVTATDPASGCFVRDTILLQGPTGSVLPNLSTPETICPGETVVLGTTAITGATYSWSPTTGLACPTCATTTATPESTTTYTLTVTGCGPATSAQVTVAVKTAPAFTLTNKTICPSSPSGIGIGASGNTASLSNVFSYSWAPAEGLSCVDCPNPTASVSKPTTFVLTVKYENGCSRIGTVTVSPPPGLLVNAGRDRTICPGEEVEIGSAPSGSLVYSWSPTTALSSATNSNPLASPITTTTYTLSVTSGGCTATDQVVVRVRELPDLSISGNATICKGGETELSVSPAANMSYSWAPLEGIVSPNSGVTIVRPEKSTRYKVTQTSFLTGCSNSAYIYVEVNDPGFDIDAAAAWPIVICEGNTTDLPLKVTPETGNYSYYWTSPTYLQLANQRNPLATPLYSTSYKVSVTNNDNNCVLTAEVPVTVLPAGDCPTFDYGDAPITYEKNGDPAKHKLVPGFMIGTELDYENTPNSVFDGAEADGDDSDGIDDEDAALPVSNLHPRADDLSLTVLNVKNDTFPVAYLAAWFDSNHDGCFDDEERFVIPVPKDTVGPSAAQFNWSDFNTQGILPFGNTYIRLRLTGDLSDGWASDPSPTGCRLSGEVEDYNVYIYPTLPFADAKVVALGEKVSGDLSLNDLMPPGTTYGTAVAVNGNPTNDMPMVSSDGQFMFMTSTIGVYNFTIPVNDGYVTTPVKLTITVLNPAQYNPPVATTDIAMTFENTPVTIKTLANDFPGQLGKQLVPGSVMITQAPQHGTASVDPLTGDITYTPTAGYVGPDNYLYKVQDNMAPNAGQSVACHSIQVIDENSSNSVLAANDQKCAVAGSKNNGNVLDNDIDPEGDAIFTVPMNITNPQYSFMLDQNGEYMFTPAAGNSDPVVISYVVYDANQATAYDTAMLCFYVKTAIGDYVWDDKDRDGVREQGEKPAEGVKVVLHACNNGQPGAPVAGFNAVTDEFGGYAIAIPPVGSYALKFDPSMVGEGNSYNLTIPNVGGVDSDLEDSDAHPVTGFTGCFEITDRSGRTDLDAGIFLDADGDFVPDCFDPRLDTIDPLGYIYCENTGEILDGGLVTVTGPGNIFIIFDGSNGFYQYLVDAPGTYTMTVTNPAGFNSSTLCIVTPGSFDPATSSETLGSDDANADDFLDDKTCDNNAFYYQMTLQSGDYVFNNNFPMTCVDLGDLPADYATLEEDNGPAHYILQSPKVFLGTIVDMEPDGQPESMAGAMQGGDDAPTVSGPDDEDGLLSFGPLALGAEAAAVVKVNNLSDKEAKLVGFVDFNLDYDFDDPGEMQSSTIPAGYVGNDTLYFDVPMDAVTDDKLGIRFRISTPCPGEPPTGPSGTPVTLWEGSLDSDDLRFNRPFAPGGSTSCNNNGVGTNHIYDIYPFTVSVTGEYVFDASYNDGDNFAILTAADPFDPANPCVDFIKTGNNEEDQDPIITANLTAGVQYYYIFTTNPQNATRDYYAVFLSGDGDVLEAGAEENPCTYTFTLTDGFGDGWDGARMEVKQGTTVVQTLGSTFTSGDYKDVLVGLEPNTDYNLMLTMAGTDPDGVGIEVYDESGYLVHETPSGEGVLGGTLYTWNTGACIPDTPPTMSSEGTVCNGEIEDYMLFVGGFDYGDLPETYNTAGGDNPPRHIVLETLKLGASVDSESDGQPDAMAGMMGDGDDGNEGAATFGESDPPGDDENGISLTGMLSPGATAAICVTAMNMTGEDAVLQAWIDFNSNGTFDAGEQLTTGDFAPGGAGAVVPDGGLDNQKLTFDVPPTASFPNGVAFARFRLSPAGGLAPSNQTGSAPFGEIEDYKFPLAKLGNLVWIDRDNDGIQEEDEPGLDGVKVTLVWAGPDGDMDTEEDNEMQMLMTGPAGGFDQGEYYFCNLAAGDYKLFFEAPADYVPTAPNRGPQGLGGEEDSDAVAMGMNVRMVMERTFTIADPMNLPTGEGGSGDNGFAPSAGYPDNQTDETHDAGFWNPCCSDLLNYCCPLNQNRKD